MFSLLVKFYDYTEKHLSIKLVIHIINCLEINFKKIKSINVITQNHLKLPKMC